MIRLVEGKGSRQEGQFYLTDFIRFFDRDTFSDKALRVLKEHCYENRNAPAEEEM